MRIEQRCRNCVGGKIAVSMDGGEFATNPNADQCPLCKGRGWLFPDPEPPAALKEPG